MSYTPATFTPIDSGWTAAPIAGPVPGALPREPIAATVPGVIHTDLLRAGLIEDPFDGDNESAQHWIGRTSWRYETTFDWKDDGSARHDLVAFGLDTVARIELNGILVGTTQNQHRSHRFDVRSHLREGENRLTITFAAPLTEVERREAEHGAWPQVNEHPFNQLRKTASNFGWDWGIDTATSGIWQPIGIDSWSGVRIAAVRPLVGVHDGDGILTADVELERDSASGDELTVSVEVGGARSEERVAPGQTRVRVVARVSEVDLWWPIGHGEHPLYDVIVAASAASGAQTTWSGRVGFRTVEVDTSPDAVGSRFEVKVNGELVLIRGANWIPDHAFVTEIDRDRYRARIMDAVDANMNLLRVWGGGIYESDDFYELADELGVLVWQDFLFACAAYSEESWLADEVEAEAREQISRLAQHPSLVIWNGSNENIWGYVEWGWRTALAGRTWGNGYYRVLFPALLAELDPTRAYSPASPYSFSEYLHPNDERNGTMHIWDVWNQRDYTAYRDYRPHFVSEFGFQGPPAWTTLTDVVHDAPLDPYGPEMLVHQKAADGNLKLERGMSGHLPSPRTIEDWHWATQLNQAHAIRFGVEHFRSLTPFNTGVIVWQLNDDWPVISWAAVDFDGHRKPLWHALKDAYAPRLATIQPVAPPQPAPDGSPEANAQALAAATEPQRYRLVLVNDTADPFEGTATLRRLTLTGEELAVSTTNVSVEARGASSLDIPAEVGVFGDRSDEVVVAEIEGFGRAVLHGAEVVDQNLAAHPFTVATRRVESGIQIVVTADSLARDVFLHVDRVDPRATVDGGLVTLLPGESFVFTVVTDRVAEPGFDAAVFTTPLVLRSANDLVTIANT